MGSHSLTHKKEKRKRQKLAKKNKKRNEAAVNNTVNEYVAHYDEVISDDSSSTNFWTSLSDITTSEKYCDPHPSVIVDKDCCVKVVVANEAQDFSTVKQTNFNSFVMDYTQREKEKDKVIRCLRGRVEKLEAEKWKWMEKVCNAELKSREKIDTVRRFWRNKIYEQATRGGKLLMAALCKDMQDC